MGPALSVTWRNVNRSSAAPNATLMMAADWLDRGSDCADVSSPHDDGYRHWLLMPSVLFRGECLCAF